MKQLPTRRGVWVLTVLACLLVVACSADDRSAAQDASAEGAEDGAQNERSETTAQPETAEAARTSAVRDPETTTTDVPVSTITSALTVTTGSTAMTAAPSTGSDVTMASAPQAEAPPVEVAVPGEAAARVTQGQTWGAFATFEDVTLFHPSNRVERIGFHESNNDGARQLEPTSEAIAPLVLESRARDTGSRTAADIVVEPDTEIRAPVTGTVIRAGGYVLYCDHHDDFAVIEPDAHPGWEVKVLHINGVTVAAGDRVEAGVTVIAPAATMLPFDSQVDEFTAAPPWPHVHIELVDPSIPDRPSTGGGC